MANNAASMPPPTDPITDQSGAFTIPWRRFFEGLWIRTGKYQGIAVVATSDTLLTFSYRGSDGVVRSGTLVIS